VTQLWILFVILAATAIYDMVYREIPHFVPLIVLALGGVAHALGWQSMGWTDRAWGIGVGLVCSLLLYICGGLGGGDVKLIAAMGAVLGWKAEFGVLFYVALFGGVLALVARRRCEAEFAYCPAIALGLFAFIVRGYLPRGG